MCELSGRRAHNGGVKILVVDDHLQDEDAQDLFKAMLTSLPRSDYRNFSEERFRNMVNSRVVQAGFELEFAFDGDEAFARYRQQGPYDLVLTDLYHPGMNGVEFARAIRRENPAQAIAMFTIGFSLGPFLEALWQLNISVADKLDGREALPQLVEDALRRNSERLAERLPSTVQ
jgi:CheY-like chemotaxis protein